MSPTIEQVRYLAFTISVKRSFKNSAVLGSVNAISKKIGITDHLTRRYLNYGLKNGLIRKVNGGFILSTYTEAISNISVIENPYRYSFDKTGTFQELCTKILFTLAKHNFKAQQFIINKKLNYFKLKSNTAIRGKALKAFKELKKRDWKTVNKEIVTGQIHLSKLLGISQRLANNLLWLWDEMKLITRKVIYDFNPDLNYDKVLRLKRGICKVIGSQIIVTS